MHNDFNLIERDIVRQMRSQGRKMICIILMYNGSPEKPYLACANDCDVQNFVVL